MATPWLAAAVWPDASAAASARGSRLTRHAGALAAALALTAFWLVRPPGYVRFVTSLF